MQKAWIAAFAIVALLAVVAAFSALEIMDSQKLPFSVPGIRELSTSYSPDGIMFGPEERVRNLFDATTGAVLEDGTIALYGVDFVRLPDRLTFDGQTGNAIADLGLIASKDGARFKRKPLAISNLTESVIAADPAMVKLPEGGYRIYFSDTSAGKTYSARSPDGYAFVFEGPLGNNVFAVDSTVIYEKTAKKYYMYTRGGEGLLEVRESADGRAFGTPYRIPSPFNIRFTIIEEGEYRAYGRPFYKFGPGTDFRYPVLAESKDALNWSAGMNPTGTPVGAGVILKMREGGYRMYYMKD